METNIDYFMYIGFACIFFWLFYFFFNTNIEYLIFLFVTVLYILSGFKIFMDFYIRPYLTLNFNFVEIFNYGIFKSITDILFYPLVLGFIGILLLLNIFNYFAGASINILLTIIEASILGLFMLIKSNALTFAEYPLWIILSIPIIINIIGLCFVSYESYTLINTNGQNLSLVMSKNNRKVFSEYKIIFIINTILIGIILSLHLFRDNPPSKYLSYLFFTSIYGTTGYLTYLSKYIYSIDAIVVSNNVGCQSNNS